jgi:phosphocarrier protein
VSDGAGAPEPGAAGALIRTATIVNPRGLHARAAAKLAKLAAGFQAEIVVTRHDQSVSARSIMGLLTLGAAMGAEVTLSATGPDAAAAIEAAVKLIAGGFGEL